MDTLGYLFIFVSIYIVRLALTGRVIGPDGKFVLGSTLTSAFEGFVTGDTSRLDPATPGGGLNSPAVTAAGAGTGTTDSQDTGAVANDLLGNAKRRGKVNKYVFGAAGPNSYDCSGLVWRALQDTYPSYKGGRFTTFTMTKPPNRKYFRPVSKPSVGTIVLWKTHVGIVSGDGVFYSARNPRSGIGNSKIDGFMPSEPAPTYWEFVAPAKVITSADRIGSGVKGD